MKFSGLTTWVFVPLLVACQPSEHSECPTLVRYDPERALADAAAAKARGERYLLGIYGFTTEVPGQVDRGMPVRMIEGTSDSRCPDLNSRTRDYAGRFNAAMQSRPYG